MIFIKPYVASQLKQLLTNKSISSMTLPEVLQTVTIVKNLSKLSFFSKSQLLRDHLLTELVSIVQRNLDGFVKTTEAYSEGAFIKKIKKQDGLVVYRGILEALNELNVSLPAMTEYMLMLPEDGKNSQFSVKRAEYLMNIYEKISHQIKSADTSSS